MSSLAQFQARFAAALLGQDDGFMLAQTPAFRVYLNTSTKAAIDALAANFPTVAKLVGEEIFFGLAREYRRRAPEGSAVLAEMGAAFPAFLADHDITRTCPVLPDIARIDRYWTEAHLAEDAPSLDPDAASQIDPDALLNAPLRLHPATRFGWFETQAATIWLSHRGGPGDARPSQGILILRRNDHVAGVAADRQLCRFLSFVQDGACAIDAAERLLCEHPGADLVHDFARLVALGVFLHPSHTSRALS